jgi:hypothetical protein
LQLGLQLARITAVLPPAPVMMGGMAVDLVRIQDRLLEASEGPWRAQGTAVLADERTIAEGLAPADADFIANAWNDIAVLVGELTRLREAADIGVDVLRLIRAGTPLDVQISLDGVIDSIEAARR